LRGSWARAGVVAVVVVVLGAACAQPSDRDPFIDGRACQAVEFDTVETALGVRFDISTAAKVEESYSCVLGQEGRSFPDLTVVISPTSANEVIFRANLWPSGATTIDGLGRGAYQLALPPVAGRDGAPSGPGLRIGWLSAAPQLMMLRYTWAADATPEEIAALSAKVVEFAKSIEQRIVAGPVM
jgi:hypothetical protein